MLLLASNSPRRRELLALTGLGFERLVPAIDETPLAEEAPEAYVLRLAQAKAQAAAARAPAGSLVLAADTTVALDGQILGKPQDAAEARQMLRALRGRVHQVFTALALFSPQEDRLSLEVCLSQVRMRPYSDVEMEAYISSGDPFDKAGAYAIQHADFHPVESPTDCYANVMGLPLCHLVRALRAQPDFGLRPIADVPQACQAALNYSCPVFRSILAVS